jgi:hypothetical protein
MAKRDTPVAAKIRNASRKNVREKLLEMLGK